MQDDDINIDRDSSSIVEDNSFGDAGNTTAVSVFPDVSITIDSPFQEPRLVLEEYLFFKVTAESR